MSDQQEPDSRSRRDSIVEPLFGGLEDASEGVEQEESAPGSIAGLRGALSSVRLWWLLALAVLFAWWLRR